MTNPVETAVAPMKSEAMDRAAKDAREMVARRIAKLEAANWDLSVVAPEPNSFRMGRNEYLSVKRERSSYLSFVRHVDSWRKRGEPETVRVDEPSVERFVTACVEGAAASYEMFVAKLVRKIGACETAELTGSHVWGYSILTVTKADGSKENWKTQQIVNVSKLGLLFNQWPSRKVK